MKKILSNEEIASLCLELSILRNSGVNTEEVLVSDASGAENTLVQALRSGREGGGGMRSKAPLSLMEQMGMLLVFALAAALCLWAFVKLNAISRRDEARAQAAAVAQTAAELIQHCGGDLSEAAELLGGTAGAEELHICYDEDWNAAENGTYHLYARYERSDVPGRGLAVVRVILAEPRATEEDDVWTEENTLIELPVAWQEALP